MPLPAGDGIPRVSARDAAYEQLRDWITLGPLEPGEPIRDAEVAARLGISRTPVREALLRLEHEGLVEMFPGRGTRVAPLRFDRARHLFSIGGALDALAAEEATPRLTGEQLDELDEVLRSMEAGDDPRDLQLLDERFHHSYYEATRNEPLVSLLESITVELRLFDRVGFRDPEILRAARGEHRTILDAFRARDAAQAGSAARFNWTHAWAQIEQRLAERGDPPRALVMTGATVDDSRVRR